MSLKDKFREYIFKQDRKMAEEDAASRYRLRNRKYHGYFEGYTEYTETRKNGKPVIRRVYTAEYYRQPFETGKSVLLRIAYVLLFFLAGYLLFSGSVDYSAGCNYVWYVTLCQACSIACLFWILTILFCYVPSKMIWKIYDYRVCHCNLLKATVAAAGALAATAVGALVYSLVSGTADSVHVAVRSLLAAAAALAINRMEAGITYTKVKNTAAKQYAGGVEIK